VHGRYLALDESVEIGKT